MRAKVVDQFGDVVEGAYVSVLGERSAVGKVTDANGEVQFDEVAAGRTLVCAYHVVRGSFKNCNLFPATVDKDKVLDVSRQLEADEGSAVAVLQATVDPGGVSADGKSLDITLRVGVIGPQYLGSWFVDGAEWGYNRLQVFDCDGRTGDELAQLGPRCIRSADGRDASYTFGQVNELGTVKTVEGPVAPWAVGLLIDQSDAGLSPDWLPNDPRLFAAKVFSDRLLPDTALLLGAFASDEPSGSAARVPQRPVTFFPVESPAFVTGKEEAFGVLNDLRGLVGGGAPLYRAISEAVDYMEVRAPPGSSRALVILADGIDTTCGTSAQCAALRREVIDRAHEEAVQLFLVGGAYSDCTPDWVKWGECAGQSDSDALRLLAREGGFPIVVQQGTTALELVRRWLLGSMTVQDVRLRLNSDMAGAFAPGATVMGALTGANASECPMGCWVHQLVFSVEIPR